MSCTLRPTATAPRLLSPPAAEAILLGAGLLHAPGSCLEASAQLVVGGRSLGKGSGPDLRSQLLEVEIV